MSGVAKGGKRKSAKVVTCSLLDVDNYLDALPLLTLQYLVCIMSYWFKRSSDEKHLDQKCDLPAPMYV